MVKARDTCVKFLVDGRYSNSPGRLEKYLAVCSPDFEPLTEAELDEITQAGKQVSYRRW
jgi:hypothetical protein